MDATPDRETPHALETRAAVRDGVPGYIVSVVGGPQDLLWRAEECWALRDGADHVARYWQQTPEGWKARAASEA